VQDAAVTQNAAPARVFSAEELRALADQGARELADAPAVEVVRWAHETFGDSFVLTMSMVDGVLAHLAQTVAPGISVLFLDTGYHFAETIGTRDAVAATYDVRVHTALPLLTVGQQDAEHGAELWRRDPGACCAMRKVEPLDRSLAPFAAWGTGLRREDAATRRDAQTVEWDAKRSKVKVNPIVAWTQADLDDYIAEHGILVNPLAYDGYPSIGCAPCTRRVAPGEDPRAGRWSGTGKVECGLHV
jgi:phosphoadenosine phosphosulfate reductase